MFGYDSSGNFDQYSLDGADFGMDFDQSYNIEPKTLEGVDTMYGYSQQMGEAWDMGVIPEGLGADYNQMGLVPSGMGGHYQQMGHADLQQMGHYQQLGQMPAFLTGSFTVGGMAIPKLAVYGGLAAAALWYANKQGMIKIPGL